MRTITEYPEIRPLALHVAIRYRDGKLRRMDARGILLDMDACIRRGPLDSWDSMTAGEVDWLMSGGTSPLNRGAV